MKSSQRLNLLDDWNVSTERAVEIQREHASRILITPISQPVRYVAGLDVSLCRDSDRGWAAAVLWDIKLGEAGEIHVLRQKMKFPYVPGLLSFREAPALMAVLRKLEIKPDALICDGQGIAHPRRFGIASHVGLLSGLPSIGCAKSLLVGDHGRLGEKRGARKAILY